MDPKTMLTTETAAAPRKGRKLKPDALRDLLRFRCNADERRAYKLAARAEGLTFSEWARKHLSASKGAQAHLQPEGGER
ncbi:MAG: hypothetical protein GY871_04025 [Actinomycetales bacterium]|nr:hypothetical protein [Actinomycetales bacterium]